MAGKSHAAGYRVAPTLYGTTLPDLRYVSIADVNEPLAKVYRDVIPFLLLRLGGVLLITYVTAITTGVLDLFVEPPVP